jgi:hypothetical protein
MIEKVIGIAKGDQIQNCLIIFFTEFYYLKNSFRKSLFRGGGAWGASILIHRSPTPRPPLGTQSGQIPYLICKNIFLNKDFRLSLFLSSTLVLFYFKKFAKLFEILFAKHFSSVILKFLNWKEHGTIFCSVEKFQSLTFCFSKT